MANINENIKELGLSIVKIPSKINTTIKIELEDNEGYKYYLNNANLEHIINMNNKPARFFRNNIFTEYNIIKYIKIKTKDTVKIVSNIPTNAKEKFILHCNIHNINFEKSWNNLSNGQFCPLCGKENNIGNGLKHTIDEIKKLALQYNIKIVSEDYLNNETPLAFICNKHKEKGIQYKTWANIISKKHSCIHCAKESIVALNRKEHSQFIEQFNKSINKDRLKILEEYKGCKTKIKVSCKKCNSSFYLRPDHILRGVGCPKCYEKSIGEVKIKQILKLNNILYKKEYRFEDCKYKRTLPFDFYLPDYNILIEYDGTTHYELYYFGNITEEQSLKNLHEQQIKDKIKTDYCIKNNIKLIRIPYWEFNNIEQILSKEVLKDE